MLYLILFCAQQLFELPTVFSANLSECICMEKNNTHSELYSIASDLIDMLTGFNHGLILSNDFLEGEYLEHIENDQNASILYQNHQLLTNLNIDSTQKYLQVFFIFCDADMVI